MSNPEDDLAEQEVEQYIKSVQAPQVDSLSGQSASPFDGAPLLLDETGEDEELELSASVEQVSDSLLSQTYQCEYCCDSGKVTLHAGKRVLELPCPSCNGKSVGKAGASQASQTPERDLEYVAPMPSAPRGESMPLQMPKVGSFVDFAQDPETIVRAKVLGGEWGELGWLKLEVRVQQLKQEKTGEHSGLGVIREYRATTDETNPEVVVNLEPIKVEHGNSLVEKVIVHPRVRWGPRRRQLPYEPGVWWKPVEGGR